VGYIPGGALTSQRRIVSVTGGSVAGASLAPDRPRALLSVTVRRQHRLRGGRPAQTISQRGRRSIVMQRCRPILRQCSQQQHHALGSGTPSRNGQPRSRSVIRLQPDPG
jgi:hypothetical protein